jgi:hypothetical protein
MIVSRAEAKFENFEFNEAAMSIEMDLTLGTGLTDHLRVDLLDLEMVRRHEPVEMNFEHSPKGFRLSYLPNDSASKIILEWSTTEKILYDRGRNRPGIVGLDRYREFATYELLYVGISKKEDSFTRLVKNPHDKRLRILTSERQKSPGAHVSDELIFLFFEVEPLRIHTMGSDSDFGADDLEPDLLIERAIADAEKAFVKFIDGRYNVAKFPNYPLGVDGLHGMGIDRYGYTLLENMTLLGLQAPFVGARDPVMELSNDGDFIFIEGDTATLMTAAEMKAALTK